MRRRLVDSSLISEGGFAAGLSPAQFWRLFYGSCLSVPRYGSCLSVLRAELRLNKGLLKVSEKRQRQSPRAFFLVQSVFLLRWSPLSRAQDRKSLLRKTS